MLYPDFALMARYNHWMNERVYDAAATLDPDALAADSGAFFGSIVGTLNHVVVTDILWLQRFATHPSEFQSLCRVADIETPGALNAIVHEDISDLRALRDVLDALISEWSHELTPEVLQSELEYRNAAGKAFRNPFGALLQHLFNHQTHHRGQVKTLLSQRGVDVGETDLVTLVREESRHA
jgi:uncharacterized damage-inducible protein DinB